MTRSSNLHPFDRDPQNFSLGSTFAYSLDASKSFVTTWRVAESETLFLNTATLAPQCYAHGISAAVDMVSLSFASPPEYSKPLPLCSFHVKSPQCYTVSSLGIQFCGPREITLKVVFLDAKGDEIPEQRIHASISVSLFGSLEPNSSSHSKAASLSLPLPSSSKSAEVLVSDDREGDGSIEPIQEGMPTDTIDLSTKVNLLGNEGEMKTDKKRNISSVDNDTSAERTLSKKARKALAKLKQEQLAQVIQSELEKENPSSAPTTTTTADTNCTEIKAINKNTKGGNVISQRRLHGGVLVKDIIIGSGPTVKSGRKVSLLYVGSLASNGKVFDKNQNHSKPLQFRLGTGQVIRGLDIGLEGMKVGGERNITIPPELGYGNKAMGDKIPKNSTLVFQVRLI